jgi:phage gpG-like protein
MPAAVTSAGKGANVTFNPPVEFINKQIGGFRRKLEDLIPLWTMFKPEMERIEAERFDAEGYGWAPLAPATLEDRARQGFPPGPILHRTGELRDSLVNPARAADMTPDTLTWGSDVEYAGYHQDGTPRMPQRKVIDIRVEDRRALERQMIRWINEVSRSTWGRI